MSRPASIPTQTPGIQWTGKGKGLVPKTGTSRKVLGHGNETLNRNCLFARSSVGGWSGWGTEKRELGDHHDHWVTQWIGEMGKARR